MIKDKPLLPGFYRYQFAKKDCTQQNIAKLFDSAPITDLKLINNS